MGALPTDLPFESSLRRRCEAAGVGWRTLRYPREDAGGETQGHRFVPPGAATGGVMLVHGAGNDALFALPALIEALTARGLEVFTFDVDGHGRRNQTRLSREGAASCIDAALDAWAPAEDRMPLHAIGISFGGALLLGSLPRVGDRLASAALISAPLQVRVSWEVIRRELGGPMLRTFWRERRRVGLSGLVPSFGPFRRGTYPLRLGEAPGPGAFGYVEVLNRILDSLELEQAARRITLPVLLVYGGRDLLVPLEQGRRLAELIPAAELYVADEQTHLTTPLAPSAVTRLLQWISRHQPSERISA